MPSFSRYPLKCFFKVAASLLIAIILLFYWKTLIHSKIALSISKTSDSSSSNEYPPFCSPEFNERYISSIAPSEAIYKKYLEKRSNSHYLSRFSQSLPYSLIFDTFLPTFTCPFHVQRLGKFGDGGKWTCGLEVLAHKPNCIVYSFGINRETSFELELLQTTPCQIFAYDGSVDEVIGIPESLKSRIHFAKAFGSGNETSNSKSVLQFNKFFQFLQPPPANEGVSTVHNTTVGEAMRKNGHEWIDILKMDIEGSEFQMFKQIAQEFNNSSSSSGGLLPFGQLYLEIHGELNERQDNLGDLKELFETLEHSGLRPFRNELNLGPIVKELYLQAVSEYSFINIKRFC